MARKKNKRHQQEENHERWLVSYADFITLMFAFFIVLYATSERNAKKTQEFEKSIKKFFVNVSASAGAGSSTGMKESQKGDSLIKPPLPMIKTSSDEAARTMGSIEVFLDKNLSEKERDRYLIDLSHDLYGVRLAMDASKLFSGDSIHFEKSALKTLDTVSYMLKNLDGKVIVESHVDRREERPKPYNSDWKLSSSRSSQVVEYMIKRHGFESERLAAMSHGSQRPLFPKGDPSEHKNQRLEFLVITEESPF